MGYRQKIVNAIMAFTQVCVLAAVAAVVGVAALSHDGASAEVTPTITITGAVTNSGGGGVANVAVTATTPGSSTVQFGPSTTAADGSYTLYVAAGTYDFHFDPPSGSGLSPVVSSNITVFSDQTVSVQLIPAPTAHTFSGILRDANGNPMQDVMLSFSSIPTPGATVSTTDATGYFSLTAKAGMHALHVVYMGQPMFYITVPSINLTNGDVIQDLQVPFQPTTLTVVVKDAAGNPLPNIPVNMSPEHRQVAIFPGAATAELRGNAGSGGTGSGGSVSATFFDGTSFSAGRICANFGMIGTACNTTGVVLNGATTVTLVKPASDTHTFSGIFRDANGNPMQGVMLSFSSIPTSGATVSTTDATGRFSLTAKAGMYTLYVLHMDTMVKFTGPSIDLTTSDVTHDLHFPSLGRATLAIVTRDAAGNPVSASVSFTPDPRPVTLFPGAAPSEMVRATNSGTLYEGDIFPAGRICANFGTAGSVCNTTAVVLNGATTVTLVKPASDTHTFSGILRNASGNPIQDAMLSFSPIPTSGGIISTTDATGRFSLTAKAGVHTLHVLYMGHPMFYITAPSINLTAGNVTQDLQVPFQLTTLTVVAKDAAGNPLPNIPINFSPDNRPVTLFPGAATAELRSNAGSRSTGSGGSALVAFFDGASFSAGRICANFGVAGNMCNTSPVVVNGPTTLVFQQVPPKPSAPTNLTAPSPTKKPELTWNAVSGASSYNIYRNGTKVGTTTTPNYTDNDAPEGPAAYYVTAVNSGGESGQSNSVEVLIDRTAPTITYAIDSTPNANDWNNSNVTVTFTCNDNAGGSGMASCTLPVSLDTEGANQTVTGTATDNAGNTATITATVNIDKTAPSIDYTVSPVPNGAGWNNGDVTVSFNCVDSVSGVTSCTSPVTVSAEGANQTVEGTAVDAAGNTTSITATVKLDKTAPTIGSHTWSANPLTQGQATTLSVTATDSLSGIASVYYTIDGGAPQAMAYDTAASTWNATFGTSLAINTYNIDIFATDHAGLTSVGVTDVLAVSSLDNAVTGHTNLTPTVNDVLPIARDTDTRKPTQLAIGFTSKQGATTSVDMRYVIKNKQNEFSFSSTSMEWVVIPDGTHASILVHGDLTTYVNGVETVVQNMTVRLDIVLGGGTGGLDHLTVKMWNPNLNPSTDAPTYQVSGDADPSQLFIR